MKILKLTFAYLILILIWQGVYALNVELLHLWKSYSFPSPEGVCLSFGRLLVKGTLLSAIVVSLKRLLLGYCLSVIIGGIIGIVLSKYRIVSENYSSLILGIQTLPSICWIPFAILWFGLSEQTILFVVMLGAIASIALGTESGIRNVNPLFIKAGENMGAKGLTLYRYIILPAAIPQLLTGLKQGWSFAFRGLMAGEMLAASKGIGQVLMSGREMADINQVTAVIIVIIAIGLVIDKALFGKLEKMVRMRWGLD